MAHDTKKWPRSVTRECVNIRTMHVGIDFRGAQCSGSGLRGIGRYTVDLVEGMLNFAPDVTITLFVRDRGYLPPSLQQCRIVPIRALSWTDPTDALWTKIPKVRSSELLHARHWQRSVTEQKMAMEDALGKNPVDLLHIPSALDIGSYPIFASPCPVVMTFLDAIVLKLKANTFDRFRPFQQRYYLQQADHLKHAMRVIAISQSSAKDAETVFQIDPNKIDVVYPAVSMAYEKDWPRPDRVKDAPYFLFCSVPDPHKNPKVVLDAFRHMPPPYQLVFVSPTESEFLPKLRSQAAKGGFSDRFHVTGYVSEEELYGLFKHAAALVSPSQMEGFGLPVAQAMRAGIPIITSNTSAQAEIAADVGYLVNPNSSEDVASAMRAVIENKVDAERLQRGIERAHLFDSERVTQQLVQVYKKAVAQI